MTKLRRRSFPTSDINLERDELKGLPRFDTTNVVDAQVQKSPEIGEQACNTFKQRGSCDMCRIQAGTLGLTREDILRVSAGGA